MNKAGEFWWSGNAPCGGPGGGRLKMCSIAARTLLEARPKLSPRSAVTGQQVTVGRLEPQVELSGLENSFVATSTLPFRSDCWARSSLKLAAGDRPLCPLASVPKNYIGATSRVESRIGWLNSTSNCRRIFLTAVPELP